MNLTPLANAFILSVLMTFQLTKNYFPVIYCMENRYRDFHYSDSKFKDLCEGRAVLGLYDASTKGTSVGSAPAALSIVGFLGNVAGPVLSENG